MKTLRIFPLLALLLAVANFSFAQTTKTETIPVSGNCGMCKKTIEKAAKTAGVATADWNAETKMLSVTYKDPATSSEKIQQAIAAAGYDTRDLKADDKAYDKLPACCKYERAVSTKASCCDSDKCGKSENCCAGMDCCKDGKCTAAKKAGHDHGTLTPKTGQMLVNQGKSAAKTAAICCENHTCGKES